MVKNPFEYLISPMSGNEFISSFWEKKYLHLKRNCPNYYADLYQLEDVDLLLNCTNVKVDQCRIVKHGKILAASEFAKNIGGVKAVFRDQTIDSGKVFDHYADGGTIILESIDHSTPKLSLFSRNLEHKISHKVQMNAYLTPERSQGFPIHHDTHDVFILQIFGSKKWNLYDSPIVLPMTHQGHHPESPITFLQEELNLNQGDLLYIPRGVQHEAIATDESSLHLTLGVNVTTWSDILVEAIKLESKNNLWLRGALPIGFGKFDDEAFYLEKVVSALNSIKETLSEDNDLVDWLKLQHRKTLRDVYDLRLTNFEKSKKEVNLKSRLHLNKNISTSKQKNHESISVSIQSLYFDFPIKAEAALDFILNSDSFEICCIPGVNNEERIIISNKLIQEGLLILE